jgi:acyl-CoA dehydrogenase
MTDNRMFYRQTAQRLFGDAVTQSVIQEAEAGVFPGALFELLLDTGIGSMLAPEAQRGVNASWGEAVAVLRVAGNAAAPGPILETMMAHLLCAEAGLDEPGNGVVTIAFPAGDSGDMGIDEVPWAQDAAHILIVLHDELVLTPRQAWDISPYVDACGEPRCRITTDRLRGPRGPCEGDKALVHAALMRAGQMLGAVEWVLGRSLDYAMERKQFGREIGKFQAVQHMLAELAGQTLGAGTLVEAAAESPTEVMVAAARSRVAEAADCAIAIGHQVHGALGFSREYPLNWRTRRLMAWRDDYGSVLDWRRRVGSAFSGTRFDGLWVALTRAGSPDQPAATANASTATTPSPAP